MVGILSRLAVAVAVALDVMGFFEFMDGCSYVGGDWRRTGENAWNGKNPLKGDSFPSVLRVLYGWNGKAIFQVFQVFQSFFHLIPFSGGF